MELDFSKKISESKDLSNMLAEQKSRKQINDLPDSDFAYIEPGGSKDESGRTVPRSLRHLPIMDCAHVKNALARLSQTKISADAKASALKKIKAAAKKCKIEVSESEAKDWEKALATYRSIPASIPMVRSTHSFVLDMLARRKEGQLMEEVYTSGHGVSQVVVVYLK